MRTYVFICPASLSSFACVYKVKVWKRLIPCKNHPSLKKMRPARTSPWRHFLYKRGEKLGWYSAPGGSQTRLAWNAREHPYHWASAQFSKKPSKLVIRNRSTIRYATYGFDERSGKNQGWRRALSDHAWGGGARCPTYDRGRLRSEQRPAPQCQIPIVRMHVPSPPPLPCAKSPWAPLRRRNGYLHGHPTPTSFAHVLTSRLI
jgi:hypothetical protein